MGQKRLIARLMQVGQKSLRKPLATWTHHGPCANPFCMGSRAASFSTTTTTAAAADATRLHVAMPRSLVSAIHTAAPISKAAATYASASFSPLRIGASARRSGMLSSSLLAGGIAADLVGRRTFLTSADAAAAAATTATASAGSSSAASAASVAATLSEGAAAAGVSAGDLRIPFDQPISLKNQLSQHIVGRPENFKEILASLQDSFIVPLEESAWHIKQIQDTLIWLNDLGLPWWSTILVFTFVFRTLILPLNISLVRNSARLNSMRKELEVVNQVIKSPEATPVEKEEAGQMMVGLFEKYKCNPFKNIITPIALTPCFLSIFMAWERLVVFNPELRAGGFLWFNDLGAVDVTYLLPVISAVTWIGTVKIGADRTRTPAARNFEEFLTYISLAMIPVTQTLPQGVFLYWIGSNVYSLFMMAAMRQPGVRKFLKIPPAQPVPDRYNL